MFDSQDFFSSEKISPPKDTETPIKSPIPVLPSSSVGSSSPVRSTTSPPDYPFDELSKWSRSNCTEDCKKLLIKKYYPRTEIQQMEDEFYNLTVKENDLKTYLRRFQELATLCPTMVSNSKKLLEAFIGGLPQSIEGNVMASKPQTLEEAINIAQRLMDQVTKHNHVQETNDHKRKLDDKRNTNNNKYPNNHDHNLYPNDHNNNNHSINRNNNNYQDNRNNENRNNDYHHQHHRRQETVKTYTATPTKNKKYTKNKRYHGNTPLCIRCTLHHTRFCTVKCQTCNK
nr:reverse transcriptase domain-containing protein [Tanacetum cinerariifolium]